jgi:hypothetical protein
MRKSAIRLFIMTLCTTALLAPAAMAGSNRNVRVENTKAKGLDVKPAEAPSPASSDMRSPTLPTFPPPMYDDNDRKAGGGAGM